MKLANVGVNSPINILKYKHLMKHMQYETKVINLIINWTEPIKVIVLFLLRMSHAWSDQVL